MRTIALINQKGGCGKTTSAINSSAAFAELGKRTLLVDLDPQSHATIGLGYDPNAYDRTIYDVLTQPGVRLADVVVRTSHAHLDLVPCNVLLASAELELAGTPGKELLLGRALQAARDSYELCVIDCPPSLGILTLNAFAAADGLLVPLQCEYYALEGISMLNRIVAQLRDNGINPRLELLGVVMTMFDGRTRLANQVVSEVREYFGERVFETMIPRSTRLAEAPSFGKPIIHYDKYSAGAAAYELLAQEFVQRAGI